MRNNVYLRGSEMLGEVWGVRWCPFQIKRQLKVGTSLISRDKQEYSGRFDWMDGLRKSHLLFKKRVLKTSAFT